MDIILGLIDSLELNGSLFFQFAIFFLTFLTLYYVLFKPYNKYAQERYESTTGSLESATQFDEEIEILKRKYGQAVKDTNNDIKKVYDERDSEAKKEVQTLIGDAQASYQKEKTRRSKEIEASYQEEATKIPQLSQSLKDSLKKVLLGA